MMTLIEFRVFCESQINLRELWLKLAIQALSFREQKSRIILRSRRENASLTTEELALLKKLKNNFIMTKKELSEACARHSIAAPQFTFNEICDLYV